MPDYTGIVGNLVCRLRGVPVFCQIIDDWHLLARSMPASRKGGLGALMKIHLYLYDLAERVVCKGQMVFAQGWSCYEKHRRSSDCELVLSAAHHLEDVVKPRPRFTKVPCTILTVGRLMSVKNQQLTIHALAMLREENNSWRLTIVGEGPLKGALQRLSTKLGAQDHVSFVGRVPHGSALWRYFDEADCFVLSSRSEGTPKVLLESMARGLPIVASAVAGVPTILGNNERGLLYSDNNLNDLLRALRKISTDETLRDRLTTAGHEFCQLNTIERITDSMLHKVLARWPELQDLTMA
jgi:glycosyltransferase involved in cell wall biosynthesis